MKNSVTFNDLSNEELAMICAFKMELQRDFPMDETDIVCINFSIQQIEGMKYGSSYIKRENPEKTDEIVTDEIHYLGF